MPGIASRKSRAAPLYNWRSSAFPAGRLLISRRPRAAKVSEKIQPSQVVPSGQEDKPQDQNQPKPKSDVLGPLTQRAPQNSFACIVQKMSAVEQWNGKKVGKPNAYGKYSCQLKQRQKAIDRHLPGHFGDA